jgi:hypothetical protein
MTASGLGSDSLDLSISGSGAIVASGRVQSINATISGSGEVDVRAIHAKALNVNVLGSGEVRGYASDAAIVNVTGSGEVQVGGKPAVRTVNRIGSGEVRFD